MYKDLAKSIICGAIAIAAYNSVPFCKKCEVSHSPHLPENNYSTNTWENSHLAYVSGISSSTVTAITKGLRYEVRSKYS
jgi:hypothetical protein